MSTDPSPLFPPFIRRSSFIASQSGYLSYPRTESTAYPNSFDVTGCLQEQSRDNFWGSYVRDLLATGINKARGGVDMGDHPPITPCRANSGELSGDMARLYELCTRHFIASVSHDAIWTSTRVELKIDILEEQGKGQGSFTLVGKELKEAGWLAIVKHKQYGDKEEGDDLEDEEEKALPEFSVGELIPLFSAASKSSSAAGGVNVAPSAASYASLEVKEKLTTPPSYLTESELIGKMEANGIGTGECRKSIVATKHYRTLADYRIESLTSIFSPSNHNNNLVRVPCRRQHCHAY